MPAAIDNRILLLVNKAWSNPLFDLLMPYVTRIGSGEFLFIVAAILVVVRIRKDKGRLGILLVAGLSAVYYVVSLIKHLVARPRPFAVFPDINLVAGVEHGFSFPSGHTAMAFMAAAILSAFFGRWRGIFFGLATAVGFSRIYIGVHFFSDVVGGAVIGSLIGYCLVRISDPAPRR